MRGWQAAAVAGLLALAGCTSPESEEGIEAADVDPSVSTAIPGNGTAIEAPPVPDFFEGTTCAADMGVLPLPWAEVASKLPQGFTPTAIDPTLAGRVATAGILQLTCQEGRNLTATFGAHTFLWHWLIVEVPDEYDDDELTNRLFPIHLAVSSEDVQEAMRTAFHQESTVATFTRPFQLEAPPAVQWRGSQVADGPWGYDASCYEPGTRASAAAFRVRSFVADGNEVLGWFDYEVNAFQSNLGGYTARYTGMSPFSPPSLSGLCAVYQWPAGSPAYNSTAFVPAPPL